MSFRHIAFTFCLLAAARAAQADTPRLVVTITDPARASQDVRKAAEKVCSTATRHDRFDEYGPMAECVDDAVSSAQFRAVAPTRISDASLGAR